MAAFQSAGGAVMVRGVDAPRRPVEDATTQSVTEPRFTIVPGPMPSRFQRWMQRVCFGFVWREP